MKKANREASRHGGAMSGRLAEAAHLQAIEGNPLSPDELAMFEMFEREGWSPGNAAHTSRDGSKDAGVSPRGMSDRDYCYPPDFTVLRNKLDIRDTATLEAAERQFVAQRLLESLPAGDFDLAHLKAIHRHLFQDIYGWPAKSAPSKSPRAIAGSSRDVSLR